MFKEVLFGQTEKPLALLICPPSQKFRLFRRCRPRAHTGDGHAGHMERDPPVFYRRDKKISRVIKGLFGLKPRQGYAIIAPMLTADKIFTKYTDYVQR